VKTFLRAMSESDHTPIEPMRLQRFLARAGVASRRHSEALITAGHVSVNGKTITELGTTITPGVDSVLVDGQQVSYPAEYTYVLLNKPPGVVTSMSDPQGRPSVAELLPDTPGLFPVGRLDLDTTGALIVTNDGELAHRLLHPSFHAAKVYRVDVRGNLGSDDVSALSSGIMLEDGMTRPADVEILERRSGVSVCRMTLREGRKRQVKRMFEAVGHPVLRLHREAFGPVNLGTLGQGQTRELDSTEVEALKGTVG
jgi:23S rRNA pseudouridine2605 synthase